MALVKRTVNSLVEEEGFAPGVRWGDLEFEQLGTLYTLCEEDNPEPGAPEWAAPVTWGVGVSSMRNGLWRAFFGEEYTFDHFLPEPLDLVSALDWAFGETYVLNRFAYSLLTGSEERDDEVPQDEDPVRTKLGTFRVRTTDQIRVMGESHLKVIDLPGEWTWTLTYTPDLVFILLFHEEVRVTHFYGDTLDMVVGKALDWMESSVRQGDEARQLRGLLRESKGQPWYDRIGA